MKITQFVILARRKDDPDYRSFYSVNARPKTPSFVTDFSGALKFATEEEARDLAMSIFMMPTREVGSVQYANTALSSAFNLSDIEQIQENGYFKIVPVVADLDSEDCMTVFSFDSRKPGDAERQEVKVALDENDPTPEKTIEAAIRSGSYTYPANFASPGGL